MKRLAEAYCILFASYFCGLILVSLWGAVATSPPSPAVGLAIGLVYRLVPPVLFIVGAAMCFFIRSPMRIIIIACIGIMGLWSLLLLYGWMLDSYWAQFRRD